MSLPTEPESPRLKVLLCNFRLAEHTPSEVSTRDTAFLLRDAGHEVAIYVSQKGSLATELEGHGLSVHDQPESIPFQPDIIHGQFNLETIGALLHFPKAPAVYLTHGSSQWRERPPKFPRIFRYLAKSPEIAAWVSQEAQIRPEEVQVLPSFIDFREFSAALPVRKRPVTALLYDPVPASIVEAQRIRQACTELDLELTLFSDFVGHGPLHLPRLLPDYDLVFASGQGAAQALALGCGVVCWEEGQIGELVTSDNFHELFQVNFTARTTELSPEAQIRLWQSTKLAPLAGWVREALSPLTYTRLLESIYRGAISAHEKSLIAPQQELAAVASWLIELAENHHAVDRGFLKVQDQLLEIHRHQEEARQEQQDLVDRLELEKSKVRAARRILSESGFINQGLQRRIEDAWREIEQGIPNRMDVESPEGLELPT